MLIHNDRTHDPYCYNAPTSSDVATIMVGDSYNTEPTNCLDYKMEACKEYQKHINHMIHYIMYFYF